MNTNLKNVTKILIIIIVLNSSQVYAMKSKENKANELEAIENKVKETFILGEISKDSPYYNNYTKGKKKIGEFRKGEIVE